ncbi:MAG: lytic transglycosylase protein, partial [Solirubrobacterales bacterium]|nr:lytic transglycosylase protein [Solirubrobacterales bacterium]
ARRAAPAKPPAPRVSAAERRRRVVRRRRGRIAGVLLALLLCLGGAVAASGVFDTAVREIVLPLKHEDIIRQQAADKDLDPALIAGVIHTESRFRDGQVSSAGALGLMQITPATAGDIARKSGGVLFETEDLASPQVNISYGAYYLRYLLNRFGGDEALALAAYNGGEGNVERWVAEARDRGEPFRVASIPFPETREYVGKVRAAKRDYRANYARELGL